MFSLHAVAAEDATGHGDLAWTADCGGQLLFAKAKVPSWLRRWALPRENQIATWELVAAVVGLWFFWEDRAVDADGFEIHLFVDNEVALGTLLRGASRHSQLQNHAHTPYCGYYSETI